jgi:uncharacterized membrane protein YdbT with pleckstrin-like domain
MSGAANEFFVKVQVARRRIFKRYLIWGLCTLAVGSAVACLIRPFPDYVFLAVAGAGLVVSMYPIRKLQGMPCSYCHYPARVSALPFRRLRCMHCHRSLGMENGDKS